MSVVTFYGASDDLIEVDGNVPGADEYNAESATFSVLTKDHGTARLKVAYNGIWSISASPIDEDFPMPEVVISYNADTYNGYTAVATVRDVIQVVREHD